MAARELGVGVAGRAALVALDATVAGSRVYLGVHYPSDVISGLLIGRAVARVWPATQGLHRPLLGSRAMPLVAAIGWPVVDRVFGISPHGLFIAIGFIIGAWLFGRFGPSRGVEDDAINSIVLWSLIGAIVGARVFYLIGHWSEFSPRPIESLYVWKGGITLLGGIAGATIANAVNIRRYRLRFFQIADALTAPLALGIAVGRIGDLIIGDHLGKPTSWVLAWQYRGHARPAVALR